MKEKKVEEQIHLLVKMCFVQNMYGSNEIDEKILIKGYDDINNIFIHRNSYSRCRKARVPKPKK